MTATKQRTPTAPRSRRGALWLLAGGVAVVALILAVLLTAGGGDAGDVSLRGDPLPTFDAAAPTAAAGLAAPEVEGRDFDGDPVAIEVDGTPKAIVFLTHW